MTFESPIRTVEEVGFIGIGSAFLSRSASACKRHSNGNVLWDCSIVARSMTRSRWCAYAVASSSKDAIFTRTIFIDGGLERASDAPPTRVTPPIVPRLTTLFTSGETYPMWDGMTWGELAGHCRWGLFPHWMAGGKGRGAVLRGHHHRESLDAGWVYSCIALPTSYHSPADEVQRVAVVEPFDLIASTVRGRPFFLFRRKAAGAIGATLHGCTKGRGER